METTQSEKNGNVKVMGSTRPSLPRHSKDNHKVIPSLVAQKKKRLLSQSFEQTVDKKEELMSGLYWNICGFNKKKKYTVVENCIKKSGMKF